MNKFIQNLFLVFLPFYHLWASVWVTITHTPFAFLTGAVLIPIAIYLIIFNHIKIPFYLLFLILFTIYHFISIIVNEISIGGLNKAYFVISDSNLQACLFFFIIEQSVFNSQFLIKLTKLILIALVITLIATLIQVKFPTFFINPLLASSVDITELRRCTSIYSWTSLNSLGISFPILLSILLSMLHKQKTTTPIIVFVGIVVSFLSKARYVMISCIVVISQLFLNVKISLFRKATILLILTIGIYFIILGANGIGYDINDVIKNRILEKENDMGSAKTRIKSYEIFMVVFPKNPWFGVGPETREDVIAMFEGESPVIHVGYLSYLYYYGIVGCMILFLALFFLLKYAWEIGKEYNFWGTFYGLVAFCLANFTLVFFEFSEVGIVISLVYLRYFKYKSAARIFEKRLKKQAIPTQEAQLVLTNI